MNSKTRNNSSKRTIKHNIRQLVWNHYIGGHKGIALCWCCGSTVINQFHFECGHVKARSCGGSDTVENLRPICGLCNRSMGKMDMFEFQKNHQLPIKRYNYKIYYIFMFIILIIIFTKLYLLFN